MSVFKKCKCSLSNCRNSHGLRFKNRDFFKWMWPLCLRVNMLVEEKHPWRPTVILSWNMQVCPPKHSALMPVFVTHKPRAWRRQTKATQLIIVGWSVRCCGFETRRETHGSYLVEPRTMCSASVLVLPLKSAFLKTLKRSANKKVLHTVGGYSCALTDFWQHVLSLIGKWTRLFVWAPWSVSKHCILQNCVLWSEVPNRTLASLCTALTLVH